MKNIEIRKMLLSDSDAVRFLDNEAFQEHRKEPVPPRTKENIIFSLAMNPEGCFVAKIQGRIAGYIFSRIWGRIGWVGTFGISPDFKGKGLGRALLDQAVNQLAKQDCTVIGLETMPHSSYNVGLYLKCGFKLVEPTLVLTKVIDNNQNENIHTVDELYDVQGVSRLSHLLRKDLDYQREVQNAIEFGWGRIMSVKNKSTDGFAILRTASIRDNKPADSIYAFAGMLSDKSEQSFDFFLKKLEAACVKYGFNKIMLPVNAINEVAIRFALKQQYTVQSTQVRMILKGEYRNLDGVDIGRWAM